MPVVSVAVYVVEPASGLVGVRVAVVPFTLYEAATDVLLGFVKVKVEELTVLEFKALLNVAVTALLTDTPVPPFAGAVEETLRPAGPVLVLNTMSTQ
jgi:hypothetical protein